MMSQIRTTLATALVAGLVSSLISPLSLLAQGALTPPGGPAPTFKTLSQVEPRTPLTSTFVGGDANYHFIITNSGSYYLTSNLNVTLFGAIRVVASNVVLDLGGFMINRVSSGAGAGVTIEATADGLVVQNGTIRGMGSGTSAASAGGAYARAGRFSRLGAEGFTSQGLVGGESWLIEDCSVSDGNSAAGLSGIVLNGAGGVITRSVVRGNTTTAFQISAVITGSGAVVRECTVTSNSAASTFTGILLGSNSVASHCVVQDNVAGSANLTGISGSSQGLVGHCVAAGNRGVTNVVGIFASSPMTIERSIATGNIATGGGHCRGIHIAAGSSVDGSTLRDCVASGNRNLGTGDCVGIYVAPQTAVLGCQADNNVSVAANSVGIYHQGYGLIQSSSANRNLAALTNSGIEVVNFGSVMDCTANNNVGSNAVPGSLGGVGIKVGQGVLISRCSAAFNRGDGIRVQDSSTVEHCLARSNGFLGDGAGIHATSSANRIEGNHANNNDRGIQASGTGTFIARNSCSLNATNWVIAAGNIAGPIVIGTTTTNISGSSGGTGFGSTDPAANVTH